MNIQYADVINGLNFNDCSLDVIYSSHMLEHLDRSDARNFLTEALRVLKKGGILRLAIPDLKKHIDNYNQDGDADKFIGSLHLEIKNPSTFLEKVKFLFVGFRNHKWMYDHNSLKNLLLQSGYEKATILKAGETLIQDSDKLNLSERVSESLYIEAVK